MTSNYVTPEQVEAARKRLGLKPSQTSVGFQSTQPEQRQPEPSRGKSLAARAADGFRAVVPQQARDAVGFTFNELDKPLSQRAGFRIPEMRGPLDEIGNTVAEELTRPSTILIAAGGAGLAGKLGTMGRVGKVASALVAPAGGKNLATRTLAEGAAAAGARGASGAVQDALPENTPTPVRVGLGLAGGVVGGTAAVQGLRSGIRGTVGRDLLNAADVRVQPRGLEAEATPRVGVLLKPKGKEQLGEGYTLDQVFPGRISGGDTVAEDLARQVSSQSNLLAESADDAFRRLGKATKTKDGNFVVEGVARADGLARPAYLQEILERPDRFILGPEQVKAVEDLLGINRLVLEERTLRNVPPTLIDLEEGQNYFHRRVITNVKKGAVDAKLGPRAKSFVVGEDKVRSVPDVGQGIESGIVYDHPLNAMKEHINRSLDMAASEHLRTLVIPFSETSGVRVPESLRAEHDALQTSLRSLTFSQKSLDKRASAAVEAYLNAAEPDLDALSDELLSLRVRTGKNAGKSLGEVTDDLSIVKAQVDALRPAWREAVALSREIPVGQASVPLLRAPALAGRSFNVEDAARITRYYSKGVVPDNQIGDVIKGVQKVNQFVTPLRAMGDASSTLNQIGALAPSHPVTFAKNFFLAIKDAVSDGSYQKWLASGAADDGAQHGLAVMGRATPTSDFELGSFLERFPGLKQAQRHFRSFTTRNRVDIYNNLIDAQKKGAGVSDLDKDRIARALNRVSGIANGRAGDLETAAVFAPNFFRSSIETVITAATDGTLEGSLARQYLRNLAIAGHVLAATAASGFIPGTDKRDMREVLSPFDVNAMERGNLQLNSNYATVRAFGQDVSLFGRFDSLMRLATISGDAALRSVAGQNPLELFDAIGYLARTKGSPVVTGSIDVAMVSNFYGDPLSSVDGAINSLAPFSVSQFYGDWQSTGSAPEAALGAAFNFFGAKARPQTAFERLNNVSNAMYQKPWDELTGLEQQEVEKQTPNLVQRRKEEQQARAARGDVAAQARVESDAITERRLAGESEAYKRLVAGEIDIKTFSESIEDAQYRAAVERDQTDRALGVERKDPTSGPSLALSDWFKTFEQATIAPNVIDWELRDRLEAEVFSKVLEGRYGDPEQAKRAIVERREAQHSPDIEWYFEAKELIGSSGYYDVQDTRYEPLRETASRVAGVPLETYGDLVRAIEAAKRQQNPRLATSLKAVRSRVDTQVDRDRKVMRLRDPNLDEALVAARGNVPIRQQR